MIIIGGDIQNILQPMGHNPPPTRPIRANLELEQGPVWPGVNPVVAGLWDHPEVLEREVEGCREVGGGVLSFVFDHLVPSAE